MKKIRAFPLLAIVVAALSMLTAANPLMAEPTYSSPITLTSDDKFVWVVNPNVERVYPTINDSVTVHRVRNDNGTDRLSNTKVAEIKVGDDPQCVAVTPDNKKAYVTNMASGTVSVINALTYAVITTIKVGAGPVGCALTPDGKKLYVANFSSNTVSVIRTADDVLIKTIHNVGPKPRAIAITANGHVAYVTRFLAQLRPGKTAQHEGRDDSKEGRVTVINAITNQVLGSIALKPINTGFASSGDLLNNVIFNPANPNTVRPTFAFPNLLQSIVIKGNRAYLPNTCSSPNAPFKFNVNVQSCLSVINTATNTEAGSSLNMNKGVPFEPVGTRLFNTNPIAVAFKHSTNEGFVVLAATNRLLRVVLAANGTPTINAPVAPLPPGDRGDIVRIQLKTPGEIIQADPHDRIGGKNPRGIVINSSDTRAYVMDLISRDVAVVNIAGNDPTKYRVIARLPSTALPTTALGKIILRGHQLFNTAIGPVGTQDNSKRPAGRMSDFGWGSCYGCHPNGLTDAVTWMFPDGPRQSISMESTFEHPQGTTFLTPTGAPKLPNFRQRVLNWSAVRDEVKDFSRNIRLVSGGEGLIVNTPITDVPDLVPKANTGRSADLDAIAAYVAFGIRAPVSPLRGTNQAEGRALFAQAKCQLCHGGPNWTSSRVSYTPPANGQSITDGQLTDFLCDVGTFKSVPNEVRAVGAGQVDSIAVARGVLGFNIPSLLSVFAGASYLHNGACPTLNRVLADKKHRSAGTGGVDTLADPADRANLIQFLNSIDFFTPPFAFTAKPCK